ncbi:hypothetical protein V500_03916, partial [Pseudogymnoascus sp. VKM F-4518 (FW-2643)]
ANILLTTPGAIQLCDFGIAATLSLPTSKRTTLIGTPHWMAPELFNSPPSSRSYGVEVDIWAFGAVVVELATGLPPGAGRGVPYGQGRGGEGGVLGLERGVGSLAAFCLEEDPRKRPAIGDVQGHPYIHDTSLTHPTSALVELIEAFHLWQDRGGERTSLFHPGGAAGPSEEGRSEGDGEWDFESTLRGSTAQDVYAALNPEAVVGGSFTPENPQQRQGTNPSRRRPPPSVLAPLPLPLEKLFDPHTLSTYSLNSRAHYFPSTQTQATTDLPLRDRDVVPGDETLKPARDTVAADGVDDGKRRIRDWTFASSLPLPVDVPETLDGLEGDTNRRTQDWTFASSLPLPLDPADAVGGFGDRGGGYADTPPPRRQAADTDRMSMGEGLIDLDMSFSPSPYTPSPQQQDDTPSRVSVAESLIDLDMSLSPSSQTSPQQPPSRASVAESLIDLDVGLPSPPAPVTPIHPPSASPHTTIPPTPSTSSPTREQIPSPPASNFRALPAPPSVEALSGVAGVGVLRSEMGRLLGGLVEELGVVRDVLSGAGVKKKAGSPGYTSRLGRTQEQAENGSQDGAQEQGRKAQGQQASFLRPLPQHSHEPGTEHHACKRRQDDANLTASHLLVKHEFVRHQLHQPGVDEDTRGDRVEDTVHQQHRTAVCAEALAHAKPDSDRQRCGDTVECTQHPRQPLLLDRPRRSSQPRPKTQPLKRLMEHEDNIQDHEFLPRNRERETNEDGVENNPELKDENRRQLRGEVLRRGVVVAVREVRGAAGGVGEFV